jgi:hypothetical protein
LFVQIALLAARMILGEVTRQRPKRISFEEFVENNEPSEVRPIVYAGGTIELTPTRQWYGDFLQRAVERDSHWTDYLWLGGLAFLLDSITVAYRYYIGEMFPLCYGPDTHVEQVTIDDRVVFQATPGTDNAGGGFLIDDPQAWGGDQPPGQGGEYAFCNLTRGNYSDHTNTYLESLLSTPPNKTPSLRGISTLVKLGPSGFEESGYFTAGGVGYLPKLKLWKVTIRRQPDNLATGFNHIGRHMNPMEVIYEWSTSLDYGAKAPLEEINLDSWRSVAQDLYDEGTGWSGRVESGTSPQAVIDDVLAQIDGILDPSPSLGLTARLIRRDYSFGSLRVLNRDNVTRVERFTPGTYEDTKNQVRVEYPDQDNNFEKRPAIYIDSANQQIQGRLVPETKSFLGVADAEQANVIATRDGRAISLPRAPLECFVFPSFGRLTYRGEVMLFEWESPSFSIIMRVLAVTPNGPEESDFRLVLIEDQFATGLRAFGEPVGTAYDDPGEGLDTAPPSATWNTGDFAPDGLVLTTLLDNTNQFMPVIEGGIVFGIYAPGGQYARLYVTEPGGVQTLSPARLVPDANNEATFRWPANAEGMYEFCVQTYSLRGETNGVKVCANIDVGAIGSPSLSPSASVSPSPSPSISPSSSVSSSVSPSISPSVSPSISGSASPSISLSPSPSASLSPSASQSPSASLSPSASQSPSSSVSPSAESDPDFLSVVFLSHFDGSDGSTTFIDEIGHTVTANGNAQIDTAQSKFGGASGLFDGTGDYLSIPDSDDWLISADYTIEGWVRFAALTGNHVFCSQYENTTNQRSWFFRRTTGNLLTFQLHQSTGASNATASTVEGAWTPVIDTWYHMAVTRAVNTYRIFAAGAVIASNSHGSPINSNQPLIFGAINSSGFTQFLNGWLDDWRITKGVARYTGAFTPPTSPFPNG